jgi:hypothetical protein
MVARISLVLALSTMSASSSEASGQWLADLRHTEPQGFVPDSRAAARAPDARAGSDPAILVRDQGPPDEDSFSGVMVVSALFGGAGAVGGVYAGAAMGGGGEQAIGPAIVSGFVGAWMGAGLGGTVASRRPGRAFLGSALGILPGLAVLKAADDGPGAVLGFVVQGMVTAFVTQVGN